MIPGSKLFTNLAGLSVFAGFAGISFSSFLDFLILQGDIKKPDC